MQSNFDGFGAQGPFSVVERGSLRSVGRRGGKRWRLRLNGRQDERRKAAENGDGLSDPGGGKPNRRGRRKQGGVKAVVPAREPVRR